MIQVHDGEFVRAYVPVYLERSLHLALTGAHAPFFTDRDGSSVTVVLRRDEWERLAPKFPSATVHRGFRLVSVTPQGSDTAFPSRLRQALAEKRVGAALLPSFHHDHVLVHSDQMDTCLEIVTRLLGR